MTSRQPNERGPGGSQHDASSPYKRSRPQSPSGSQMRPGPAYYQDPRYGMAVAAVAAGGYGSIYRDPFQPTSQVVEQHARDVREQFSRDRIPVAQPSSHDADLLHIQKHRRPTLLDYHHGTHAPGVDRTRQYRPEPPSAYGQHYRQETMGNLQGGLPVSMSSSAAQPSGPTAPKRPRLGPIDRPDLAQPLSIDVSQTEPKREPAYNPQTEAISPTLPPEETLKVQKVKDELLQNISRIDREIALVEQQIQMKLKKKQQQEEAASKHKEFVESEEVPESISVDMKHQSIAQIIYAENRKKAAEAHNILSKLGPKVDLPLYNQPSDAPIYHENKRKFALFKPRLILHFKKRHQARKIRERYLTQRYDQLMQAWVKKVEKWENNPKRKAKEAKLREYFEKIFPELKKARDDKERLSRGGTRTGLPVYARSEAELEQIMDGIHEQEEEDRKMRNLAVIPPMMFDARQRSLKFVNKNGLITDCMEEYKERKYINVWTAQEKQIFKEKYLQHPKNFGLIASFLEKKSTMDCVEYYYRSKKSENYKQMLRKQTVKKKRQQQKAQPQAVLPKEEGLEPIASSSDLASQAAGTTAAADDNVNIVTSSASGEAQIRPESTVTTTSGKEKEDDDKEIDDSSDDNDTVKGVDGEGGVHPCAICKTQLEHYGLSRPLTTKNCELYGIIQSDLTPEMRVCSNCWCKSVRRRYTQCPVPSCKTPKRKVKRLRPLPTKWADLTAELKEPIMKDLQITDETMKCCSACFNRIARRMECKPPTTEPLPVTSEPTPEVKQEPSEPQPAETQEAADSAKWTDEEIELAKKGLREHGKDWAAIATVVGTKSESQCSSFYSSNKKKYNLELITVEKDKEEDGRTISICESVASTVTAPSDGEQLLSDNEENRDTDDSGTASAPSPRPLHLDDRDVQKDEKPDSSQQSGGEQGPMITTSLATQKSLSTSEGSLRSIPDNDSTATLSADEGGTHGERQGDRQGERQVGQGLMPAQQQTLYPGSILPSALPTCNQPDITAQRNLAQVGAMGLGLVPRAGLSPTQSHGGNSNQSFPSRPGSRASPAVQGQIPGKDNRPNSRPSSSHEVPIIREANPNQAGGNPNVLDFSQSTKQYSPYQSGVQPRRPTSAMSEPGMSSHRAVSPHIPPGTQPHMMIGLDPSRVGTPPTDKKPLKPATCVRDLIYSAIEMNLSRENQQERPQQPTQDRPRSTDTSGFRPSPQQLAPGMPHDLRATDLRKDPRGQGYDPRGSPYQLPGRDPRDIRGDPRDIRGDPRGPPSGGMDLSMRQPDGVDKVAHGYKGDPRDFEPLGSHRSSDPYRGQSDDPQQRKVISMATPPPAHAHRRSPFQIQEAIALKGRSEGMEKSPSMYQDRHSPNVRGLPQASSPYSPHGGKAIPPPPPLINSTSSRLPKSPPTSHLQAPPSGSITHGTPVGPHTMATTSPSVGMRPQQPNVARGSITQGTPVREMGRGMMHPDQGAPRGQGQYDMRMMEQMRGVQQMYDPRMIPEQLQRMHHPAYQQSQYQYNASQPPSQQPSDYNSKQTLLGDFITARTQMRHPPSPTDKEGRDPRDQSISPRAPEHPAGPPPGQKGYQIDPRTGYHIPVSSYMQAGQQPPSSSRVSPRPSSSMPSPRDDKAGSPWLMAQRPSPGNHASPHLDPNHQYQGQGPPGRPSITQGTGRQSVITDSRNEDRYRNIPDSSGAHHSPRVGPGESYLQMPSQTGDHRRSPSMHPDYTRQQYERERERQEKEMKDREQQMAVRAVREQYQQGVHRYEEQRLKAEAEAKMNERAREEYLSKMRANEDPNKRSPKLSQPTDILKAFVPDSQQGQRAAGKQSGDTAGGKGNRSMTAACLIDAIIVHQINQSTEETPTSTTSVSQAGSKPGAVKQEVKSVVSQSSAPAPHLFRQTPQPQSYPGQGQPAQGHIGQGQGYMSQGQPPMAGQQYQGQPPVAGQQYMGQQYQGQKVQHESKSPPAQMAGKKRWMQSPVPTPGSAGSSYSPGASTKSDPDSKPDSRPSSRGSGGGSSRPQDSALRQAVLGSSDMRNMTLTLGDHINDIIHKDYEKNNQSAPLMIGGKSFLSQINGSIQADASSSKTVATSRPGNVSSTSVSMESTTTWSTASSSSSSTSLDSQKSQASFPGPKKFKWRQASEQASSTGQQVESGGGVSQSSTDEPGSRPQEVDWTRQMRPDQSHSPTGGQPTSPPGQADSSSSSAEVKSALRKGMGIQDSEVSPLEYVQNKIAQCLHDESNDGKQGPSNPQGQSATDIQQAMSGRGSHSQMMPQPTHSSTKSRTQSPVSSQMAVGKENSHKHARPEPRQGGPVVSTSVEMHGGVPRQQDISSVSPSSSSLPSPDQHSQDEDPLRGGNYQKSGSQAQSPVSSAGDNRDQVHSSQHPHRKGRMFTRPRSRMEQEEPEKKPGAAPPRETLKQSQRASPSASVQEGGRVMAPYDKKGPKSEYDFPDSPDDEGRGKPTLSSYMALSSSTRSPRRGIVDSSENRVQPGGDSNREGEVNVESSEDISTVDSKVSDSGPGKDNEAQEFERFGADQIVDSSKLQDHGRKGDEGHVSSRVGAGSSHRKQSLEADDGSNISHTSADSTDRLMVDESANIDSSATGEVSSAGGSRRSSKSSRDSDNSPHPSTDFSGSAEHSSHGRQGHRSRSPRSYPQSSSDLGSSAQAGSSVQYSRRGPDGESGTESREQEPQPLLSSQYETLSDDEQS
ncbi:nuclear receptor corepressor 1-like isoform X2 [Mercenaria mercenaria]|uniref:nuclear receptor corepressor 1-like isoform X2 n=1 Tax=Mercenaria mercenaria TaxID=6596 RepID=UPI00234F5BA8|nr:nuclear receptor corepressor 1-like isoform X2 [Mercenaria mercenaria]